MTKVSRLILIALLLGYCYWVAEEASPLEGCWVSSTGASIQIGEGSRHQEFPILVTDADTSEPFRLKASWLPQSHDQFRYHTPAGEVVTARLVEERVELTASSWRATWRRETDLFQAIEAGDLERVQTVLSQSPSAIRSRDAGETPLHLAVSSGHLEIASLLLEHGSPPNSRNDQGATPLHLLVRHRHPRQDRELFELLVKAGAQTDASDDYGQSPLEVCSAAWRPLLERQLGRI